MTAARGGPVPELTAADTAVDLFASHPTLALTALVVLIAMSGWVLVAFGSGLSELWAMASDAVARRWPRLATPAVRWRSREEQCRLEQERRGALQLATLVTLLRLSARR